MRKWLEFDLQIDVIYHLISGILLFPISLVARMLALLVFRELWNALGSSHVVYDTDYVLLAYGGLKGALALLLVHEFTESVEHDPYASRVGEKVVLYASSAVFVCLVIQGMTFSYVTNREGTNRRSRYIKDSEKNVERHLNRTLRSNIGAMRRQADSYLTEANWAVVNEQIEANVFKGFARNIGQYSRVQTSFIEESMKSMDSQSVDESSLMKKDNSDVCTSYYSILLARVYSLWSLGAVAGRAAHLVIDLLEHGVDEGQLTLADFREHIYSAEDKWWCVFSAFLAILQSLLIAFAIFWRPEVPARISYAIFMFTFLIAFIFFTEEIVHFHRLRKPTYQQDLERLDMGCISRLSIEFLLLLLYIFLIFGICVTLSVILAKYPNGSCVRDDGRWRVLSVCNAMRFLLLSFLVLLALLKLIRATPLFIFTLHEALYSASLIRIRVQLSALYFLQFLLSQPPAKFTFFPGDSYQVALGEQKHLNKIVDALIRKVMKQSREVLDLITVIKTKQAIRMAAQTLEHTVVDLQKLLITLGQGFLHHESMQQWERSLTRLREHGERLVSAPVSSFQDLLESVHWIQAIDIRKRQDLIDKLVKHFEQQQGIEQPNGQLVQTFEKTMYFVQKGICKFVSLPECF
ncbi:unnamed protein product [Gongylonema pulchrum]|uniref:TRP domain-containing protein n=1 Tax=Gongylonema pulchrum TaxID=637853 RepID=A0A183CWJ5_9BILA|nr:unnamed protein product [Gongylonema pulchrum]